LGALVFFGFGGDFLGLEALAFLTGAPPNWGGGTASAHPHDIFCHEIFFVPAGLSDDAI
jgi:hypothetical protein